MRITLFSKNNCEPCEMAKKLLIRNGYEFDEVRADRESAKVMRDNAIKGFPALFVDDEFKGDGVMAVVNFMKEQKAHPWIDLGRSRRGGGAMRKTAESVYIKNTFSIRKSVEKGLIDYKQAYRELTDAQQRYKENLKRMDGRHER